MTDLKFPAGLSEISDSYDVVLCDVWGVIHNGRKAFEPACDALMRFRETGKPVCLVTNAPVPKAQVVRYFEPLGVPESAFDDCVSSGDATRAELEHWAGKSVWILGADGGFEHDRHLYEGIDLTPVTGTEADVLLCIGLRDAINEEPEDYRNELAPAAKRGVTMICANPDIRVRVGGDLWWCAGALAEIYKELGGTVIYPGKPFAPIYKLALQRLVKTDVQPERVLCIGDSPATDVRGARLQGFHSLYVGTGLKEHGNDFEGEVRELLTDYQEAANWAMTGLRW